MRLKHLTSMCVYVLSHSVVSDSLRPHGLQPARLLCPWGFSRQEHWSELPCPSTPFINAMQLICMILMTSSWEIYSPHFLNNGIASWRNAIIYTSFLWSQYCLYHNHGQAREWREMTEILYKWNKYNFRNTDFLWKNSFTFFLVIYNLQYHMGQVINTA